MRKHLRALCREGCHAQRLGCPLRERYGGKQWCLAMLIGLEEDGGIYRKGDELSVWGAQLCWLISPWNQLSPWEKGGREKPEGGCVSVTKAGRSVPTGRWLSLKYAGQDAGTRRNAVSLHPCITFWNRSGRYHNPCHRKETLFGGLKWSIHSHILQLQEFKTRSLISKPRSIVY